MVALDPGATVSAVLEAPSVKDAPPPPLTAQGAPMSVSPPMLFGEQAALRRSAGAHIEPDSTAAMSRSLLTDPWALPRQPPGRVAVSCSSSSRSDGFTPINRDTRTGTPARCQSMTRS